MSKNPFSIAPGVIIENVGDEVVVFTSESAEAIKLSGPVAQTVVAIQAGKAVDASATGVSDLVELGIIRSAGMSRRGLITAGAVGAGAGIAMLSMPAAAAASSPTGLQVTSAEYELSGMFGWLFTAQISGLTVVPAQAILTFTYEGTPYTGNRNSRPLGTLQWSLDPLLNFTGDILGSMDVDGEQLTATFVPATT